MEARGALKSFLTLISILTIITVVFIMGSLTYLHRDVEYAFIPVLIHSPVRTLTTSSNSNAGQTIQTEGQGHTKDIQGGDGRPIGASLPSESVKSETKPPTPVQQPGTKSHETLKPTLLTKGPDTQNNQSAKTNGPQNPVKAQPLKKPTKLAFPKDARKDVCVNCFVHNFTYLIQNEKICDTDAESIDLLILILTIHRNALARSTIRSTWLSTAKQNNKNVRYAFLLGKVDDMAYMKRTYAESEMYGDILMEDFTDSYSNLTYKTIMGMKWASLYCPKAKYLLKTDDDMWVNVPEMLNMLNKSGSMLQSGVGGACNLHAGPIRHKSSKWYASVRSYPHNSYPGFCSGTGYVTSMNVARKVYEVSPNVPFFHLEDVYVALCIRKLGLKLFPIRGFHNTRATLDACKMKSPDILTVHRVPTALLPSIYKNPCNVTVKANNTMKANMTMKGNNTIKAHPAH